MTILFACVFLLLLSRYLSARGLAVSRYTLTSDKLDQTVRMVHLTDLHNSEFGAGNRRLIEKVAEQEPDLIVITGDLLNQNDARTDVAESLVRDLCQISPVYVSFGNHETVHMTQFGCILICRMSLLHPHGCKTAGQSTRPRIRMWMNWS